MSTQEKIDLKEDGNCHSNLIKTNAFHTALCIIPPTSMWAPIQAFRCKYDKAFKRWMPHINLCFPFVKEHEFEACIDLIREAMREVEPFKVDLIDINYFDKSQTAKSTESINYKSESIKTIQETLDIKLNEPLKQTSKEEIDETFKEVHEEKLKKTLEEAFKESFKENKVAINVRKEALHELKDTTRDEADIQQKYVQPNEQSREQVSDLLESANQNTCCEKYRILNRHIHAKDTRKERRSRKKQSRDCPCIMFLEPKSQGNELNNIIIQLRRLFPHLFRDHPSSHLHLTLARPKSSQKDKMKQQFLQLWDNMHPTSFICQELCIVRRIGTESPMFVNYRIPLGKSGNSREDAQSFQVMEQYDPVEWDL